jgi:beta-lactamase class D
MKKIILFLAIQLLFSSPAMAYANCFLAKENNQIITQEGDCKSRHAPCSTFKIAISLMGYDDGFLIDETHPQLPFKEGYVDYIESWRQPQNPTSWLKNSCVWYSQLITQNLGMDKFKKYLQKFNYGNQDSSGDKGKNNGLTKSWLSSSLKISPIEQVAFLQKFLNNKLPVSATSNKMTKNILFIEDLPGGWKLYGKTGTGYGLNKDGSKNKAIQAGWFVGWIQKNNRNIVLANYMEEPDHKEYVVSKKARQGAKERLIKLIESSKNNL